MGTHGWRDNYLVRMTRPLCIFCLISLATCCHAQVMNPECLVGRSFWYEPSHDKYVPTEFYNSAAENAPTTRILRKTRIRVVATRKNWFAIRYEPTPGVMSHVYMPAATFFTRLYRPGGSGDASALFMRASLFENDPDVVKKQFESKDKEQTPGSTPKPSAKLKPWQKYKENWGSITPPPKKNKNLLLDDIKPPREPEPAP